MMKRLFFYMLVAISVLISLSGIFTSNALAHNGHLPESPRFKYAWDVDRVGYSTTLRKAVPSVYSTSLRSSRNWSNTGDPFDNNLPPDQINLQPFLLEESDEGNWDSLSPSSNDPKPNQDINILSSRNTTGESDFTIVIFPDTQYYTAEMNGGSAEIFNSQTQWTYNNRVIENITFATHLGDIVENGDDDTDESEWINADNAMKYLENHTTDPTDDVPFGVTPGNHDLVGGATKYEAYFSISRFNNRPYYGGYYGTDNLNSYTLFSAGGMNFITIHINSVSMPTTEVLDWVDALLKEDTSRKGIIVTHYLIGDTGVFHPQGEVIYSALQDNCNLCLMLGGHSPGEGLRIDTGECGNPIYSLLADYQFRSNGGEGWMRLLRFVPDEDKIYVTTYSPWLDQYETDADSQFELDYVMGENVSWLPMIHKNSSTSTNF